MGALLDAAQWSEIVRSMGFPTVVAGVMIWQFIGQAKREASRAEALERERQQREEREAAERRDLLNRLVEGDGNGGAGLRHVVEKVDGLDTRVGGLETSMAEVKTILSSKPCVSGEADCPIGAPAD